MLYGDHRFAAVRGCISNFEGDRGSTNTKHVAIGVAALRL